MFFKMNIKNHGFLHSIMTIITYFWIKYKIYIKKVPVITNNTLTRTTGFVNMNFFRHISPSIF